jgi:mutator protein MutT
MQTRVVTKVLIVNEQGEVLALRRSLSDEHRPGGLDFPGGKVEEGEHVEDAVVREAFEESGLELDPATLQIVYGASDVAPHASLTWVYFLYCVEGRPEITLSDEHSDSFWMSFTRFVSASNLPRHKHLINYLLKNDILKIPATEE